MTGRQRVLAALERRETDRLPVDFAGTDCSSMHVISYHRLRRALGIELRPIRLACLMQQVVEADEEIQNWFGADAVPLYFYPRQWRVWESYGIPVEAPALWRPETLADGSTGVRNSDGEVLSRRAAGGFYFDPAAFRLASVV